MRPIPPQRRAEIASALSTRAGEAYARQSDEQAGAEPAPALPQGKTSVQTESTLRGARTIDQFFTQRTATECGGGPFGFVCRERVRFELCRDRWTKTEVRGMSACHVLARQGPPVDQ